MDSKTVQLYEDVAREVIGLQKERTQLLVQLELARLAYLALLEYRQNNTLNFQLEKLDDYLRKLENALEAPHE